MTLPVFDMSTSAGQAGFQKCLARLRQTVQADAATSSAVAAIIDAVRREGDEAVVWHMRKHTDPDFSAGRIRVTPDELAAAQAQLNPALRRILQQAIDHVRKYQTHILPSPPPTVVIDGAELGLRFTPVDSAGLAVPGGKAAYPSSVVMLAVPAQAAGVPRDGICVVTPPPTRRAGQGPSDVSPLVLAACALAGVEKVFRIGGPMAMAALAYGTQSVPKVDMIVGPSNIYGQLAKAQLAGVVGIDGFYGPSEIVTIADGSAHPKRVASDLIAQAEHDPGKCFLIATKQAVLDAVLAQIQAQLPDRQRRPAIESALANESCALLVANLEQAAELCNQIAPEHLNLAVADPDALLANIRHAGEIFLGDATPVAAGDYWAGPSHCLPTGTTARFASGISVYTFLKRSGTVAYRKGMAQSTIAAIGELAQAEGLDAHAASVEARAEHGEAGKAAPA